MAADDTVLDPSTDTSTIDKKRSWPLGPTKKAAAKLQGILDGAHKTGKAGLFKGALAYDSLRKDLLDFADALRELDGGRSEGRTTHESLRRDEDKAEKIVKAVLNYVDTLYDHDIAGRGAFFPVAPGQQPLAERLAACMRGVAADAKRKDPVLPSKTEDPLLDMAAADAVHKRLQQGTATAGDHEDAKKAAMSRRNAIGDRIRDKVVKAERFVRQLHEASPAMLKVYGLRAFRHQW